MASIVALRMIKALMRLDWSVDRASGTSHHVLTKEGYRPITVPVKKGRTLKEGTARAILRQAGISENEFFDVYLTTRGSRVSRERCAMQYSTAMHETKPTVDIGAMAPN